MRSFAALVGFSCVRFFVHPCGISCVRCFVNVCGISSGGILCGFSCALVVFRPAAVIAFSSMLAVFRLGP